MPSIRANRTPVNPTAHLVAPPGFLEERPYALSSPRVTETAVLESAHFVARCLRYRLHTERLQLKTLMHLDLKGSTAIDIGANKGIYSFWLSRAVGPAGRVLAFEPQPEMIDYIEDKKSRFRLKNITTFNVALSNAAGTASLLRQRIGDGSASLEPERIRDDSQGIRVAISALDDISGISNVSFIKCDVEGHEFNVFEGGRRLIERHMPIVQFEATAAETKRLFDLFEGFGYVGFMYLDNQYRPTSDLAKVPHRKFGMSGHRDAQCQDCALRRRRKSPRNDASPRLRNRLQTSPL